jgi:hypothetical protein
MMTRAVKKSIHPSAGTATGSAPPGDSTIASVGAIRPRPEEKTGNDLSRIRATGRTAAIGATVHHRTRGAIMRGIVAPVHPSIRGAIMRGIVVPAHPLLAERTVEIG